MPRNPNRIGFWQLESIDMPRFDLRQDRDTLKPLASFQVLTVMCCPTDRIRRERMMGDIEATGIGGVSFGRLLDDAMLASAKWSNAFGTKG